MNTLLLVWVLAQVCECTVISVAQGMLRGIDKGGYILYGGIPYASVGKYDRFKKAGLAPSWSGVRESQRAQCSAAAAAGCLQLDVYMPAAAPELLPVLAWARAGNGDLRAGRLARSGVVVVVVTHRFGPLGFLCSSDERIPGNAGVKDFVLALRWVRDNIVAFRGNPEETVIGGQGFGAAMVEALKLSQMGEGLYRGVILQSGTILSPTAFYYDAEERTIGLAKEISNDDDVIATLLNADTEELIEKANELEYPYFPFGVCTEEAFKKEERLLSESPYTSLSSGRTKDVPMLVGFNSNEAYVFASALKSASATKRIQQDISFLLPEEFSNLPQNEINKISEQIKEIYFRSNRSMEAILRYQRDAYFVNHIHRSLAFHAASSEHPVYYYQFSYSGQRGVELEPGVPKTGAAHSDELAYLFPQNDKDFDGTDDTVQRNLITLWTNFVKYLEPTGRGELPAWEPTDAADPRMLSIGADVEMMDFPYKRQMDFWDHVYNKYYYKSRS